VLTTMRIGLLLMGFALVAAAGGCGGSDDEAEAPSGGGARLEGELTYTRGGGIAGRTDRLVVRPDGSGSLTTRTGEKPVTLSGEELTAIADELQRAKLPELPAASVADPPAPDAFAHRVVYEGTTVTADDPSMPDRLRGLVGTLGRLVDAHESG
jgi:hypothetical protein